MCIRVPLSDKSLYFKHGCAAADEICRSVPPLGELSIQWEQVQNILFLGRNGSIIVLFTLVCCLAVDLWGCEPITAVARCGWRQEGYRVCLSGRKGFDFFEECYMGVQILVVFVLVTGETV